MTILSDRVSRELDDVFERALQHHRRWNRFCGSNCDRTLSALSATKARVPLMISGDLHSIAAAQIRRSGALDLSGNPVTTVVAGPIGTGPQGWPSHARGTAPKVPNHLDMFEHFTPVEQHGFTLLEALAFHRQFTAR